MTTVPRMRRKAPAGGVAEFAEEDPGNNTCVRKYCLGQRLQHGHRRATTLAVAHHAQ